jgi:hypothetical protein
MPAAGWQAEANCNGCLVHHRHDKFYIFQDNRAAAKQS